MAHTLARFRHHILPGRKQGERILVVEDEERIRRMICRVFIEEGYQCESVAGGFEALSLLESGEKFDLLFCDLLNAPGDGVMLLERAKAAFPEMLVLLLTAIQDTDAALACFQKGAYEYFDKPFDREQLLATVSRAFAYRRLKNGNLPVWEDDLYRVFIPVVDQQLSVPILDEGRKHVRDLGHGDVVPVRREDGLHWFHLVENNGKLAAIDFMPTEQELLWQKEYIENQPEQTGDREGRLKVALRDALHDIWLHSGDYHHVTPVERLSAWQELLAPKKDVANQPAQTTGREGLLDQALRDALRDIWLHSHDYHYVTPQANLLAWHALLRDS